MYKKKVKRMDVLECMDYSNSADGSKPLTNPMSVATNTKPDNLSSVNRTKCRRALLSAPSSVSSYEFLTSVHEADSDASKFGIDYQPGCEEAVHEDKCVPANTFFEVGFVTARDYMNPAGIVLTEMQKYAETSSVRATCESSKSSQPTHQAKKTKSRLPVQKNSLDNYFKQSSSFFPSQTSKQITSTSNSSSSASCTQSLRHSDCSTQPDKTHTMSSTPENSPCKTVMNSPLTKLAGSNAIYYCLSSSQDSNSRSQPDKTHTMSSTPENSPCKTVMNSPLTKLAGSNAIYYCLSSSQDSKSKSQPDVCRGSIVSNCVPLNECQEKSRNSDDDFDLGWRTETETTLKKVKGSSKTSSKRRKTCTKSQGSEKGSIVSMLSRNCSSFLKTCDTAPPSTKEFTKDLSDDMFGMFGFSDSTLIAIDSDSDFSEEVKPDFISVFPVEVLTNVLCRLPLSDLCLNVNRVCLQWSTIISSAEFMPWKKTYHRLLKSDNQSAEDMKKCMLEAGMTSRDVYLAMLVRFLRNFKPLTGRVMGDPLHKHRLYQCAVELMNERFPGCITADKLPNPWCLVVVLVILANAVADVSEILQCMLGCRAKCTAEELIDCLYCIASFLLMFKKSHPTEVWTRLHYQLYYALYLYENDCELTFEGLSNALNQPGGGQQSICRYSTQNAKVRLTHEQLRICNYNMKEGEIVKIVAFAGTGKTTTLLEYARLRPSVKFLLIVYNKSVKEHAKERFPANVQCFTSHGLAYKHVGIRYAKKLGYNVKVNDVLPHMRPLKGLSHYVQAKFIVDTLNKYMVSADESITSAHVPETMMHESHGLITIDHHIRMSLSNDAEKIWKKMISLTDCNMRLPHDGYLKLWQLQRPHIQSFDIIMIDEAQDLTPAVADIFRNQTQARIMVGDPHQQIYSFRGAINAMDMVRATCTFYLTQSFRFGPEIASIAATCLEFLKGEKCKILVGNGQPGGVTGEQDGQLAIITRTNFQLFKEAVTKCVYSDRKITIAFAGGIDAFGFDMVQDIYTLMNGSSLEQKRTAIKNNLIKGFIGTGYGEFKKFVSKTVDAELFGKIRIAETYREQLVSHIQLIKSKTVSDMRLADIVLSTAHKAKGLEFDTVMLSDDYNPDGAAPAAGCSRTAVALDECNLLYVAITRAKKRLQMSPSLITILKQAGYDFCQLKSTKLLLKEGTSLVCGEKKTPFQATNAVTLFRPNITTSNGNQTGIVVYGPEAVVEKFSSLRHFAGVVDLDVKSAM